MLHVFVISCLPANDLGSAGFFFPGASIKNMLAERVKEWDRESHERGMLKGGNPLFFRSEKMTI